MQLISGVHAVIADGAEAFARAVIDLYTDEATWTRIQKEGAAHVDSNFSEAAVRRTLQRIFCEQPTPDYSLPAKVMA
jgi:glycosyltransferase involved in cell wall biosynthesis